MKDLVKEFLKRIGEDLNREGLLKTPERVEETMRFLTQGYSMNIDEIVNGAIYNEKCDEIVMVKNIQFYSLCEHHLLPFFGRCHVGYLPGDKIIGLSKIPRIVDMHSKKLQLQERMTLQIAQSIEQVLEPKGVAVVTEAYHLCMMMRGVEKDSAHTVVSTMLGVFRENAQTRAEFLKLLDTRIID